MLERIPRVIKPFGRRVGSPANDEAGILTSKMNTASQSQRMDAKDIRIAELEIQLYEANKRADTDDLTGLFNRARFIRELKELGYAGNDNLFHTDRRSQGVDYLLMIDLDGFKMINDTYGHEAGDKALCVVADFLKSCVRETDIVARKGGDEFTVIMTGSNKEAAEQKLQQIIEGFETLKFDYEEKTIHVRGSVGVCPIDPAMHHVAIIKAADDHMYQVKKEKGDTRFMLAMA